MVRITEVERKTPAAKAGIKSGYLLKSINGKTVNDVLDYQFYAAEEKLLVCCETALGEERFFKIEKDTYEDLGLNFETYLMDAPKSCKNKCIFCFIDQLPKGMRETLYFKDDDTRLSFLTGNYVTLTNVSDENLRHIAEIHISPINISVHTVNPALRIKMLANKNAGKILEQIKFLAANTIQMNCQIVLCKGQNDGEELLKSMETLLSFYPHVNSLSVVPAGLTKHRDGLYPLEDFTPSDAREVIRMVNAAGEECLQKFGARVVYPADEFFLKGNIALPPASYYEDFPQIENGVGMMASFLSEARDAMKNISKNKNLRSGTIVTGTAAFPFISMLVDELKETCNNLNVNVVEVKNTYFGETITVAGLLTGFDIIREIKDRALGEILYIPTSMLRSEQDVFLDNVSLSDLEKMFSVKTEILLNDGYDFVEKLLS